MTASAGLRALGALGCVLAVVRVARGESLAAGRAPASPVQRLRGGAEAWGETCSWCGQPPPRDAAGSAGRLLRCSWCRAAFYCGKECQRAHWPAHRSGCPPTEPAAPPAAPRLVEDADASDADPDRPKLRVRRRIEAAEETRGRAAANAGRLPPEWQICRACRLPVIPEWFDCPACDRPISELDEGDAGGLLPEQSGIVQRTKHLGDPQSDLLEGAETNNMALMSSALAAGANISGTDPELYDSGALHYAAGQVRAPRLRSALRGSRSLRLPDAPPVRAGPAGGCGVAAAAWRRARRGQHVRRNPVALGCREWPHPGHLHLLPLPSRLASVRALRGRCTVHVCVHRV